jgi:hypothetical protein
MKKVAVIIKHPYRDNDFRVDIIEVDDTWGYDEIVAQIEYEMLGPFEVIGLSTRISDRKFPHLSRVQLKNTENKATE